MQSDASHRNDADRAMATAAQPHTAVGSTPFAEELDRLHHVAIAVDDIEVAVEFYTREFRCRVAYQDPTWALLDFANVQVALVIPAQHPPHVAFESPTAEQRGPLKTHRDGTRSLYINDPAGNSIEIMAPTPRD